MKAIILAGGFGTRIREIIGNTPKPMAMIAGKPFLEHLILYLRDNGIKDIILTVHYMADQIKSYFGDGGWFKVNITYSEEEVPLGTGGAIKKAERYIDDTFLVLNGDTYSQLDIKELFEFHRSKKSNFTMALTENADSAHYGSVILDESRIVEFSEKAEKGSKLVNSGVYIFEPKIFNYIPEDKNVSLEKDIFPRLAKEGSLYGYKYNGYYMDIGRPETYKKFKQDVLDTLLLLPNNCIQEAMKKISKSRIDLILIADNNKKLLGVLNDKIIKNYLMNGGSIYDNVEKAMIRDFISAKVSDDKEKLAQILQYSANRLPILDEEGRIYDVEFRTEKIKIGSFPVIYGKSPFRISFAGGGTDVPYFFEKYGGVVINSTIDKHCHATLIKRADRKIVIDSDVTPEIDVVVDSIDSLKYNGKLDLIKAVIKLMKPNFGFDMHLYNDVPPGNGLGSSASLAVLVASMLNNLLGNVYDDYKIVEIAHKAEREELGIKGGWQDQYAAITGGFSFMEFNKDKTLVYPLNLKQELINELNHCLFLCSVGSRHFSGDFHKEQEKCFKEDEEKIALKLNELKKIAIDIKECLLKKDINKIGELLHESWEKKRSISQGISNPNIDRFYNLGMDNGALGGKLLGAGGAGYILFFVPPRKRNRVIKSLIKSNAEILDFNFEPKGTQIWSSVASAI
jgi:D-glycero-alpha-D-manno-heptose-7-phosphate kinase